VWRRRAISYIGGAVRFSTGHGTGTTAVHPLHGYTAPLFDIIAQHRVNTHHIRRRLTTVYLRAAGGIATMSTGRLDACLADVEARRKASRLRLNPSKTPVKWLGFVQQLAKVWLGDVPVLSSQFRVVDTARNLGVVVVKSAVNVCTCCSSLSLCMAAVSCGNCGHSRDA